MWRWRGNYKWNITIPSISLNNDFCLPVNWRVVRLLIVKGKTPFLESWGKVHSRGCELARSPHIVAPATSALWRLGTWREEQDWVVLEGDSRNPCHTWNGWRIQEYSAWRRENLENCLPLRLFCRVLGIKTKVSKGILPQGSSQLDLGKTFW